MTGQALNKGETGIYHIMGRGINRQIIFEDDYSWIESDNKRKDEQRLKQERN